MAPFVPGVRGRDPAGWKEPKGTKTTKKEEKQNQVRSAWRNSLTERIRNEFSRPCSDFGRRHRNSCNYGPCGAVQGIIQVYLKMLILCMLLNLLSVAPGLRVRCSSVVRIGVSLENFHTKPGSGRRADRTVILKRSGGARAAHNPGTPFNWSHFCLTAPRDSGPVRSLSADAGGTLRNAGPSQV